MNASSLLRDGAVVACASFLLALASPGCGRTSLEPEELDAGASVAPAVGCAPQTCPSGCCDDRGVCRTGTDVRACGSGSSQCADCTARGLTTCGARKSCSRPGCDGCQGCCDRTSGSPICFVGTDPSSCGRGGAVCVNCASDGRICEAPSATCSATKCDASNCAGCCVGNQCVAGTDDASCGARGSACESCTASGGRCAAQPAGGGVCVGIETCGPANCAGCCEGTTCRTGEDAARCGKAGAACQDCAATGRVCAAVGQPNERTCEAPPACGPATCAGCCVGDACVVGSADAQCGRGGAACADCTTTNGVCQGQACTRRCSAATCTGCCRADDSCALGFANDACGGSGAACVNCAAGGSTCNVLFTPPVCANTQTTCPATYGGCDAAVTLPLTPTLQRLCSDADLDALRSACSGGPDTAPCVAGFAILRTTAPACATCLLPFDEPFLQLSGVYRCAAPSLSAACRRAAGCAVDCTETSCTQCPAATSDVCRTQVNGNGGQCNALVQQTVCVAPQIAPGQLCSPLTHAGNFGRWLSAVGRHFCGNGP